MESDLRAARRGRALWERWSMSRLTFLLSRKRTASALLADTAFQRTFFSLWTASTLAPLSTKASIKDIKGERAALQRA